MREIFVWAYVIASLVGFATFLALGYHHTPPDDRLESLSFLITATDALKWSFAVFLTAHAIAGGFTWYFLIQRAYYSHFATLWIIVFEFYTGLVPCDTPDSEAHFLFATLAFGGFIVAGIFALWDEAECYKQMWGVLAISIILISFALLVVFGVWSYQSDVSNEGPLEWTAIFLLAWLPGVVWCLRKETLTGS